MITIVSSGSSQSVPRGEVPRRHRKRELVLILAEFLLAVGAVAGAVGLIVGAIDLGDAVNDLPFDSPVLGGVALGLACGVLPTVVAVGALRHSQWAPIGHVVVGAVLVGWIVVQVAFIGLGSWLQVTYGLLGLAITALAVSNLRARRP